MKSFKSVFAKAACMLALVSVSNSFAVTQAQVQPQQVMANDSAGNIRFVRMEEGMLVFDLNLRNLPAKGSMLRITDGDNNILFEGKISTETYNVRYKIVRGGISKIDFEISAKKIILNQSFNVKTRTEEKVEVLKA